MGECLILKSGGGTDTSDATASASQILTGYTAYVNDVKITGSMVNRGTVTSTLNCGGSYTIPVGYHNGSGTITVNSLASQTEGNGTNWQILSGYTAWSAGTLWTGVLANWGAVTYSLPINGSYTIPYGYHNGSGYVNQAVATQGATWIVPNTVNQIAAWGWNYVTGNITVQGSGNLVPWHIKKGVWIFGVCGTWQGF